VAAARQLWQWRQRESATSAAAWRRQGGGGSKTARTTSRRNKRTRGRTPSAEGVGRERCARVFYNFIF
jgi:hypothetical protein